MNEQNSNKENTFQKTVRPLALDDLLHIKPILERWIRDSDTGELVEDELAQVLDAMRQSTKGGNDKKYFVAETHNGQILGVMGYKPLKEGEMFKFAKTDKAAEVINANVSDKHRGIGIGTALLKAIEEDLKVKGFKEFVLNSGPRYQDTAWGFYDKLLGQSVGTIKNFYQGRWNARVWRKVF